MDFLYKKKNKKIKQNSGKAVEEVDIDKQVE
jgi:hypothetical protein